MMRALASHLCCQVQILDAVSWIEYVVETGFCYEGFHVGRLAWERVKSISHSYGVEG